MRILFAAGGADDRRARSINLAKGTFARTGQGSYLTGAPTDGATAFMALAATDVRRTEDRGDGAGRLVLLERASTGTVADSANAAGSGWSGTATQVANSTAAPDGTTTADTIENVGTTFDQCRRYTSGPTASQQFAMSAWIKQKIGSAASIQVRNGAGVATNVTPTSVWQRAINAGVSDGFAECFNCLNGQGGTGLDVDEHYWWGIQAETGRYPTSYIPTAGSSASRGADVLTFASLPAWFFRRGRFKKYAPIFANTDLASGDVRWLFTVADVNNGVRMRHDGTNVLIEAVAGGVVKAASQALTFTAHANLGVVKWDRAGRIYVGGVAGPVGTAWTWTPGAVRFGGIYGGSGSEADARFSPKVYA
jgi:hypothetical protein